jgi:hypothetical protein
MTRDEPAFNPDDVTYCAWWDMAAPGWRTGVTEWGPGADPDGSRAQLTILGGDPALYQQFARDYYEVDAPLDAVEAIYRHRPLTRELILALNPDANAEEVLRNAAASGYGHEASA